MTGLLAAPADEVGWITDACERAGATHVAATDDEDENEMLMVARRTAIPAVERLGTVLIQDLGLGGTGTGTGEHGVGWLKARHVVEQLGPDVLRITKAVKAARDPNGILNPRKWVGG